MFHSRPLQRRVASPGPKTPPAHRSVCYDKARTLLHEISFREAITNQPFFGATVSFPLAALHCPVQLQETEQTFVHYAQAFLELRCHH